MGALPLTALSSETLSGIHRAVTAKVLAEAYKRRAGNTLTPTRIRDVGSVVVNGA